MATTALSHFWDTTEEMLFLGPWCLRYDRRHEWEGLTYRVMPSPWDDRTRFSDAVAYLDACGERMLGRLADYLNAVHGVAYRERYWRILIGPWLLHDLHAAYDRYVHLTCALTACSGLRTTVLDPRSFRVPTDTTAFLAMISDDPYNLQIFSQQLRGLGYTFPTSTWDGVWKDAWEDGKPQQPWWQRTIDEARVQSFHLAERGMSGLQGDQQGVALCEMSCARSWLWALAWRSRLRAVPREVVWDDSRMTFASVFDERRKNLATLPASDEFERLFVQSLPSHLPTLYLEGYHSAREAILQKAQRMPAVIISAAGWHYQEPFKFLAAEASEQGSRLVAVQHGGGYGIFRHSPMEHHERRVADTFMTWGWADGLSGQGLETLPSPMLSSFRELEPQIPETSKTVLFVSTAHLRYLLRFHSSPVGIHTPAYLQWQFRFLTAMPDRLRRVLRFRPYPQEFGYAVREQITRRLGPVGWDQHRSFSAMLSKARVVVIDHSSTTFLEALRCGVPTVLFWDPRLSEVRKEAEPSVEALRAAGILWNSPEEAAAHVAAIYHTSWEWWGREAVQKARRRFIERYALGRRDWLACWAKTLEGELACFARKR